MLSPVQIRYEKVRKELLHNKLIPICEALNITPPYSSCIIVSTIKLLDEYVFKKYNSSEDYKHPRLSLTIITLASFWIATKFHDDKTIYVIDIQYVTKRNWKLIVKEELKILQSINFNVCKFMLEDNHPLLNIKQNNIC